MTPNEITTLIATNLEREMDVPFKKQLYDRVKYWRATLIKQSLDRVRQEARYFKQTIYLPMEKVNALECSRELQCFAAKSVEEVPLSLRINDYGLYSYVGGIDGVSPWGFADSGVRQFLMSGKYTKNAIYYDWVNRHIMVTKLPDLPKVRIEGVFSEPEVAMQYECCECGDDYVCDWWNKDMPVSDDILQRIVQSILSVDYDRPVRPDDHQVQVNETKP